MGYMLALISCTLLAVFTLISVTLLKTYTHVPRRELRRRARTGDDVADLLYRAASYGPSLEIFLWLLIGLGATGFFVIFSRSVAGWAAMLGSLILLWFGFAWLPYTRVSKPAMRLARAASRPLAWILQRLFPFISWLAESMGKWRLELHTGLYEKEDVLDLLHKQTTQFDSRISAEELHLAYNALTFGDKMVRDIMLPKSQAKMVAASDVLGPILLTELYDSGQTSFPVYEGTKRYDKIVGTLYLHDVVDAKRGGTVRAVMHNRVFFMNDETHLDEALQEFMKSKHHLYVVVNDLEDLLGVVTIESIMSQLLGEELVADTPHEEASTVTQSVVESE